MSVNKHQNYEILNLIGYGLAKFDTDFVKQFGYKTKTDFFQQMVKRGDQIITCENCARIMYIQSKDSESEAATQ